MNSSPSHRGLRAVHLDQDGLSAGAEALVFGVLVFLIGSIIVLNGWAVLDAKFAVSAAAREATRTIVELGNVSEPAGMAEAVAVAGETMRGHGKDPDHLEDPDDFLVTLATNPWAASVGGPLRCAEVTIHVSYPVQGIEMPWINQWQGAITVTGQHTEIIDPLRSGLEGSGDCG